MKGEIVRLKARLRAVAPHEITPGDTRDYFGSLLG